MEQYCGQPVFFKNGTLHFKDSNGNCIPLSLGGISGGGSRGVRGAQGNQGAQGGSGGAQGVQGTQGATGSQGSQGFQGAVAPCITNVTYAQLTTLIGANGLDSGCQYLITDFQTIHTINNTAVIHTGTTEPIIITASTSNTIYARAISTLFPKDEILYEVVDSTTSGGTKGRIYYRWDTESDNQTWYDWRSVVFRRWESAPASGVFNSVSDNGGSFIDLYTFNEIFVAQNFATAPDCFSNEIREITYYGITQLGAPTSRLNNTVLQGNSTGNFINRDNFDNSFGTSVNNDTITNNYFDIYVFSNIINGPFISDNHAHKFTLNSFSGSVFNNQIGEEFSSNIIGIDFGYNVTAYEFAQNTIGDNFQSNVTAPSFSGNTIGDNFMRNTTGQTFTTNTIGDDFQNNVIGVNFTTNTIADFMQDNVIGNQFQVNTITGTNLANGFKKNHIESGVGVNFTGATHVYADYTFIIQKRSDSVYRGHYFTAGNDAAGTVTYVAPNA